MLAIVTLSTKVKGLGIMSGVTNYASSGTNYTARNMSSVANYTNINMSSVKNNTAKYMSIVTNYNMSSMRDKCQG